MSVSDALLLAAQAYLLTGAVYAISFWGVKLQWKLPTGATINDKPVFPPLLLLAMLLLMAFLWLPVQIMVMQGKLRFSSVIKSEPRNE